MQAVEHSWNNKRHGIRIETIITTTNARCCCCCAKRSISRARDDALSQSIYTSLHLSHRTGFKSVLINYASSVPRFESHDFDRHASRTPHLAASRPGSTREEPRPVPKKVVGVGVQQKIRRTRRDCVFFFFVVVGGHRERKTNADGDDVHGHHER